MNRAVFLDRDGTLVKDVGHCVSLKDLELLPGAAEGVALLTRDFGDVICITNQSVIGRGWVSEYELAIMHYELGVELGKQGGHIRAFYYCPHLPDAGCQCRKPGIALFQKARDKTGYSFRDSYVVGDRAMDIQAGKAIGAKTIWVDTGPCNDGFFEKPDYSAKNLLEAAEWILRDIAKGS